MFLKKTRSLHDQRERDVKPIPSSIVTGSSKKKKLGGGSVSETFGPHNFERTKCLLPEILSFYCPQPKIIFN
jgi:hypothetical protein